MKTVLIVEDEIFVAMDIQRTLEEAGYDVVGIAADREEALAVAHRARIAFVDLNLRDGPTGPMLARDLSDQFDVRIVYVTANPAQIDVPARNAVGCISKPFNESAIVAAAGLAMHSPEPGQRHDDVMTLHVPMAG